MTVSDCEIFLDGQERGRLPELAVQPVYPVQFAQPRRSGWRAAAASNWESTATI
jgi:hypothetical protein